MKKIMKLSAIAITTIVLALALQKCNKNYYKDNVPEQSVNTGDNDNSDAITAHILAFKQRMKYFKDNPGLKDEGDKYTADSAVIEMEASLNFTFCYTDIQCNKKTFEHSEVTMPLDNNNEISEADISTLYDVIIDTIKAQMYRVNYDSMKLLLVDLERTGTDNNGDAIISVGSLIGNEGTINVLNSNGWKQWKDEWPIFRQTKIPQDLQADIQIPPGTMPFRTYRCVQFQEREHRTRLLLLPRQNF